MSWQSIDNSEPCWTCGHSIMSWHPVRGTGPCEHPGGDGKGKCDCSQATVLVRDKSNEADAGAVYVLCGDGTVKPRPFVPGNARTMYGSPILGKIYQTAQA